MLYDDIKKPQVLVFLGVKGYSCRQSYDISLRSLILSTLWFTGYVAQDKAVNVTGQSHTQLTTMQCNQVSLLTTVDGKRARAPFHIVSLHGWPVEYNTWTLQQTSIEVFSNNENWVLVWQVRVVQDLRIVRWVGNNLHRYIHTFERYILFCGAITALTDNFRLYSWKSHSGLTLNFIIIIIWTANGVLPGDKTKNLLSYT